MRHFKPSEIVCLDSQNNSLYCEVIEVLEEQEKCWTRPVILVNYSSEDNSQRIIQSVLDLRFTSDLLWNLDFFRPVFDTEYFNFCYQLSDFEFDEIKLNSAKKTLRNFIEQIWKIHSTK